MKNKEIKLLWKYIKPHKKYVILYMILTVLKSIGTVFTPVMFGLAIEALTNNQWETFLGMLIAYFIIRILVYSIIDFNTTRIYNYLEMNFVKKSTQDMYKKVSNLPAIAFEEKGTGEITNRLTQDPEKVISLLSSVVRLGSSIFGFIFVLVIFVTMSWIITIEAILFICIMSFIVYKIFPKIEKMEKENRNNSDKLNKIFTENITGIREIKALGTKNILNRKVNKRVDKLSSSIYKTNNYMNAYWQMNNLVYYIFELLIFITAGYLVIKGNISLALFISLQFYIWRIDEVVYSVGDFSKNYSKVKVALNRIDEIVNNVLYKDETFGNKELKKCKGTIIFDNVSFKYPTDKEETLTNLNLVCEPNKKIAIIGKSGNGKSTLFNLLVRYFDTTEGNITIDNININELSEKTLRDNISIIRQNPHIFNMSIIENLRLVKPSSTDEEIHEVCKKAYIHDYITSLSDGYDTMIGEGGVNLSGGQKQRLAIARTLLVNTKIILFDEATSALDNESQEYIKKTIDQLVKNHTIIIVAHRLSTIIDADIIHVINEGKVVASGNHKSLLKNNVIYKKLYKSEM